MSVSWLDAYTLAARNAANLPDRWFGCIFTRVANGVTVEGAVCPDNYERGPRKGDPKWATRDRTTQAVVFVSGDMVDAARAELMEGQP